MSIGHRQRSGKDDRPGEIWPIRTTEERTFRSAEVGARTGERITVYDEIDLFVVKAGESRNLLALRQRRAVDPDQIRMQHTVDLDGPVRRISLVRAGTGAR